MKRKLAWIAAFVLLTGCYASKEVEVREAKVKLSKIETNPYKNMYLLKWVSDDGTINLTSYSATFPEHKVGDEVTVLVR